MGAYIHGMSTLITFWCLIYIYSIYYITLTVVPDIAALEPNVTVIEGSMATLTCSATGDPVPFQSWSWNGNVLTSGGRYQISGNGSVLTVEQVTEAQDEGVFTCHASNEAGEDSATVTLNVLSKQVTAISSYHGNSMW